MVEDPVAAHDVPAEHPLELLGAVAAVGARGDEDGHVLGPDLRHLLEERLEHLLPRLSASDVADRDGDSLAGLDQIAKRCASERRTDGLEQRGADIGHAGPWHRLDDRRPFTWEVDLQALRSVVQSYSHGATSVPSGVRNGVTLPTGSLFQLPTPMHGVTVGSWASVRAWELEVDVGGPAPGDSAYRRGQPRALPRERRHAMSAHGVLPEACSRSPSPILPRSDRNRGFPRRGSYRGSVPMKSSHPFRSSYARSSHSMARSVSPRAV